MPNQVCFPSRLLRAKTLSSSTEGREWRHPPIITLLAPRSLFFFFCMTSISVHFLLSPLNKVFLLQPCFSVHLLAAASSLVLLFHITLRVIYSLMSYLGTHKYPFPCWHKIWLYKDKLIRRCTLARGELDWETAHINCCTIISTCHYLSCLWEYLRILRYKLICNLIPIYMMYNEE